MELSAVLGGGESALLLSTISSTLESPLSHSEYEDTGRAVCSNLVEDMFYATQRAALRAIASGHNTTMCVILNQCANTLSMVIPSVLGGKRIAKAVGVLLGTKTISAQAAEALAKVREGERTQHQDHLA